MGPVAGEHIPVAAILEYISCRKYGFVYIYILSGFSLSLALYTIIYYQCIQKIYANIIC
jgi:hypothetical protein